MLTRHQAWIRGAALVMIAAAAAPGGLEACSGPPAPSIAILPQKIEFSYTDPATGNPVNVPAVVLMPEDGRSSTPVTGDYQFCGGEDPPSLSCYDDVKRLARLEIPAGAKVWFQAYYDDHPSRGSRTSGSVAGGFSPIENFVNGLASTNGGRRIRLSEIASRGSGQSFNGAVSGPKMVLDWANIDPDQPDLPLPSGFKLELHSTNTSLPAPAGWNGPAWTPATEKWYTVAGEINDSRQVIRTIRHHMAAYPDAAWIKLEIAANKLRRIHFWIVNPDPSVTHFNMNDSMFIALEPGDADSVSSTWEFDVSRAGDGGLADPFLHIPVNGRTAGIGFNPGTDNGPTDENVVGHDASPAAPADFNQALRRSHTYVTPSEPAGYLMRATASFKWKYGHYAASGSAWQWQAGLVYGGYVNLEPANISDTDPEGMAIIADINAYRSQLACLPSDSAGECPQGPYTATPSISTLMGGINALRDQLWNRLNPCQKALIYNSFLPPPTPTPTPPPTTPPTPGPTPAPTTPPCTPAPSSPPAGMVTTVNQALSLVFNYCGTFMQGTAATAPDEAPPAGSGQPGFAFVTVRDTSAPRHFEWVQPGSPQQINTGSALFPFSSRSTPENLILERSDGTPLGETGRTISEVLAGGPSKIQVRVFDDNPGLAAFVSHPDAIAAGSRALRFIDGADITAALQPYQGAVTRSGPNPGNNSRMPSLQAWYSVQKAGYRFKPGFYYDLGGDFIERIAGSTGLVAAILNRHRLLGNDSHMEPYSSFRFYPFRDPSTGAIKEYPPVAFQVMEAVDPNGGQNEPIASILTYEIDLNDMLEPMGFHFADGSQADDDTDPDDGAPLQPGYDASAPFQLKLFVRAGDGRIGSTPGMLIDVPPEAGGGTGTDYERPNFIPFWYEPTDPNYSAGPKNPEHAPGPGGKPSPHFGRNDFPNDTDLVRDVMVDQGANNPIVPPATSGQITGAANTAGFTANRYGKAAGITVRDTYPPTIVLMVTDGKYDRTAFFGNALLGDMTQEVLQRAIIAEADDATIPPADANSFAIDPAITAAGEGTAGPFLFPRALVDRGSGVDPATAYPGLPPCSGNPPAAGDPNPCMIPPDGGAGNIWTFTYDQSGDGAGYLAQLDQWIDGSFNPMNFWALPTVLTNKMTTLPGLWVDEDSRLSFRIVAWDNLNSYMPLTQNVGGFEGIHVYGDDPPISASGPGIDVTVNDPGSGAPDLKLSGSLAESWPGYIFRNPNRLDQGGSIQANSDDAFVEVRFQDRAGNESRLHVKMFVIENSLRILSLKEDKLRTQQND